MKLQILSALNKRGTPSRTHHSEGGSGGGDVEFARAATISARRPNGVVWNLPELARLLDTPTSLALPSDSDSISLARFEEGFTVVDDFRVRGITVVELLPVFFQGNARGMLEKLDGGRAIKVRSRG